MPEPWEPSELSFGKLVSPLKMAEVFSLKSLLSEGSFYRSLSASIPLWSSGFKFRLYYSKLSYDVIADEFKALNISGEVDEEGLELSYLSTERARQIYIGQPKWTIEPTEPRFWYFRKGFPDKEPKSN